MARINLYIPDELKLKMAKRPDINWSLELQRIAEILTERDWLIVSSKPRLDEEGERQWRHSKT